jgi:hypothetical protein
MLGKAAGDEVDVLAGHNPQFSAPLPLAGRGWGEGLCGGYTVRTVGDGRRIPNSAPLPSPPRKGEGAGGMTVKSRGRR